MTSVVLLAVMLYSHQCVGVQKIGRHMASSRRRGDHWRFRIKIAEVQSWTR